MYTFALIVGFVCVMLNLFKCIDHGMKSKNAFEGMTHMIDVGICVYVMILLTAVARFLNGTIPSLNGYGF